MYTSKMYVYYQPNNSIEGPLTTRHNIVHHEWDPLSSFDVPTAFQILNFIGFIIFFIKLNYIINIIDHIIKIYKDKLKILKIMYTKFWI